MTPTQYLLALALITLAAIGVVALVGRRGMDNIGDERGRG